MSGDNHDTIPTSIGEIGGASFLRIALEIEAATWDRLPFVLGIAVGCLRAERKAASSLEEQAVRELVIFFEACKRAEVTEHGGPPRDEETRAAE